MIFSHEEMTHWERLVIRHWRQVWLEHIWQHHQHHQRNSISWFWKSKDRRESSLLTDHLHHHRWSRTHCRQDVSKRGLKCSELQIQREATNHWKTISDELYWLQNVDEYLYWKDMNTSHQADSKDCHNTEWHERFIQVRTSLSSLTSIAVTWIHDHSRHHWCAEQVRRWERTSKATKEESTIEDNRDCAMSQARERTRAYWLRAEQTQNQSSLQTLFRLRQRSIASLISKMFSLWRQTSSSRLLSSVCSSRACEEMQRQRQNKA